MNYLLDTNVISELAAVKPNPKVIEWIERVDAERVFLSVITIGELKKGIEKLSKSKRKESLNRWLAEDLLVRFEDHLLAIDTETMLVWGAMNARLEAAGRPISAIDGLLAASAMQHGCTLVTRNAGHFEYTDTALFNPWEE